MKKSQKILFGVLCVFALAAILGITWMTASRVTSAQIYEELQAMPVTNKTSEISAYLDLSLIHISRWWMHSPWMNPRSPPRTSAPPSALR